MALLRGLRGDALSAPPPPVLSARNIEKRFGRAAALRGIDIDLPAGRIVVLLGPNGAGKSTLLRILAGLSRPSAGEIFFEGEPLAQSRRRHRAQIGFKGHETALYSELSARENLVFSARLFGVPHPEARADALRAEEGLTERADQRLGSLSRGTAQRLALARARVHDPQVLLLDEPFTGLDRPAGDGFAARLADLRNAGRSVLLVTHDLARAAELADSFQLLRAGRCVFHQREPLPGRTAVEALYREHAEGGA